MEQQEPAEGEQMEQQETEEAETMVVKVKIEEGCDDNESEEDRKPAASYC